LVKLPNIKFQENKICESQFVTCGQKAGQINLRKLMQAFLQVLGINEPKRINTVVLNYFFKPYYGLEGYVFQLSSDIMSASYNEHFYVLYKFSLS
jgi:hypothetical protein